MSSLFSFQPNVRFDPPLEFGCAVIRNLDQTALKRRVAVEKKAALRTLTEDRQRIEMTIEKYSQYFSSKGFKNPLTHQFKGMRKKGFPTITPLVDALLVAEMTSGHLMGVQDWAKTEGPLIYDVARDGESFAGMRGPVECWAGEMVLRDDAGIIASYFQGPDDRTKVDGKSSEVVFFAFSAPGVEQPSIESALNYAVDLCDPDRGSSQIEILSPQQEEVKS